MIYAVYDKIISARSAFMNHCALRFIPILIGLENWQSRTVPMSILNLIFYLFQNFLKLLNVKFRNANHDKIYLKIFFALSVLINATLIVFANVGDSRAILIRKNFPYFTTEAR